MRRTTFSVVRDYVASGAGLAGGSSSPPPSSPGGNEVMSDNENNDRENGGESYQLFSDLPIGSILFPSHKSRAQVVKIDRHTVSQGNDKEKGKEQDEHYRSHHAVKAFTRNVLLNSDFIESKKKPKVLISVTGGAGAYVIPPSIEPIFSKGLMKAARATNAWIVTGGTDSGVMKTVGDAYHKHSVDNVPCIGIASYNAINNKEILVPSNKMVEYTTLPGGAPHLNPYHTQFILVDGQRYMKSPGDVFGHEIEFRSDLESYLCSGEMFNIPLLLVVVGGGPGTLKTVYEGIKRKFPVVVLNKTGGVADAISYRIQLNNEPGKKQVRDEWDAWVKREGPRITPEHEQFMQMIVQDSEYVRIYDPDQNTSLEVFLFESIFNCDKYGNSLSKMELAVSCNQLEVASGLIDGIPSSEKSAFVKKTLQFAVESDRPEIFDSLIEGTVDRSLDLQRLYKFIFAKRSRWARFYPILSQTTIKQLEQTQQHLKQESKLNLHEITLAEIPLEDISSSSAAITSPRNSSTAPSANTAALFQHFLDDVFLRSGRIYDYYKNTLALKLGINDGSDFEDIPKTSLSKLKKSKLTDVLLWALLMGHADLAKVLWTHTTLPVHTALIASHFCKLLSERFSNEGTGYTELAVEFETKAIQLLAKMSYKEARAMLCYKYDEFKMNLLEIADLAESKEFTSHPYIQRYVDELLFQNEYGEVPPSTSMWKVVLCIIPLFYFWIFHPKMKNNDKLTQGKYSKFKYYTLPVVKFWSNTLCYIGFIVLCSYVLIVSEPKKYDITGPEILLFLWMGALLIEELSQLMEDGPVQYLSRVSNQIDMLMLSLFVVYFILKLIAQSSKNNAVHTAATDLFVVATIIVYLRLLNMFAFSAQLGPLYFVVLKCIDDILQWLFIFVLFCFGTTIAIIVCVKQNGGDPFKPFTEGGSFAVSYYTIIGEYTEAFGDLEGNAFGLVILAIYALIAQIVLVNLLIAMMGDTFNTVKEESNKEWRFMRYSLATEYSSTSAVAPPFNLVYMPIQLVRTHLVKRIKKSGKKNTVQGVTFRRLKTVARKFVEEIIDDEKEEKKKDLAEVADSIKSHIKKLGSETSKKLIKIEEKVDSPASTRSLNISATSTQPTDAAANNNVQLQAQLSELQRAMATIKESLHNVSANSFQLQVGSRSVTVTLSEGINLEVAKKAVNEFGPLASWIQMLQTQSNWSKLEIHISSIFTAPSGKVEFVNFSTKIESKE